MRTYIQYYRDSKKGVSGLTGTVLILLLTILTAQNSNATNNTVTWSSSNTSITKVNDAGKNTGLQAVTATKTAYSDIKSTSELSVKTAVSPESINISADSTSIFVSLSEQLSATVLPSDADDKTITWTSSDPEIATVNAYGVVKGITSGTIVITAITVNELKDSCIVEIIDLPPVDTLEAENATYESGTIQSGATGQYMKLESGGSIKWNMNASIAGLYALFFNVNSNSGAGSLDVYVNDEKTSTISSSVTDFAEEIVIASLNQGSNTIELRTSEDTQVLNVDYLKIKFYNVTVNSLDIEAESASDQNMFSPFEVIEDESASEGFYMVSEDSNSEANDNVTGQAVFNFELAETADIAFSARVDFPNGNDDSFFYKIDNGSWKTQNSKSTTGWQILSISDFNALRAGRHAITILRRESGAKIDKINISALSNVIHLFESDTIINNRSKNNTLTINVLDIDGDPVENAVVKLGQEELTTGIEGTVFFDSLAVDAVLPYSIEKDTNAINGTITVFGDVTLSRTLLTEELDIFLALGQSNMAGRATITESVSEEINGASLLNDVGVWVPAVNPMNLYSNIRKDISMQRVGPSYSFSKTLSKYVSNRIGMVVNARGGTSINTLSTTYIDQTLDRINTAKTYGNIKGIIWHQGEANRSNADSYMNQLDKYVTKLREKIGSDVFFVAGQLGPWDETGTTVPKYGIFNDTISNIASYIQHSSYANNNGLTDRGDNTHFDLASQIILGQRYAKEILSELYNIDISIIDLDISGEGYVVIENDTINTENDYSITSITNNNIDISIAAGKGKQFTQLFVNGIEIESAVDSSFYNYSMNISNDTILNIQMTIKDITVSAKKKELINDILIYPNPAKSFVNIDVGNMDYELINIYCSQGSIVRSVEFSKHSKIDVADLPAGYYLCVLSSRKRKHHTSKLLIISH